MKLYLRRQIQVTSSSRSFGASFPTEVILIGSDRINRLQAGHWNSTVICDLFSGAKYFDAKTVLIIEKRVKIPKLAL